MNLGKSRGKQAVPRLVSSRALPARSSRTAVFSAHSGWPWSRCSQSTAFPANLAGSSCRGRRGPARGRVLGGSRKKKKVKFFLTPDKKKQKKMENETVNLPEISHPKPPPPTANPQAPIPQYSYQNHQWHQNHSYKYSPSHNYTSANTHVSQ